MNSYFASVEQQANPFLRGKSVGVCATKTIRGCIIASSIEAKAKGIKTGCRVGDAIMLDPSIVLVENDSNKYRTVTKKILGILMQYTEALELYSIDEAFLDLTGHVQTLEDGARVGREIQQRIQKEVGEWLRCSVGVAATRWLAKFAGDTAPKGTVLILRKHDLPQYYKHVKLTDAWGIGTRMERRLNALGITTLNDLRTFPLSHLVRALGTMGYYLWADVNGLELSGLAKSGDPKSIGHSHVLTVRRDRDLPRRVLMKLCEKTGRRLRALHLQAQGLSVWWSFVDGGGFHRATMYHRPFYHTQDIFLPADALLQQSSRDHDVASLAVSVFSLAPRTNQLSFFDDPVRRDALTHALDRINDRYGEYTVIQGSMWATDRHVPDRVGFRKTAGLASQVPVETRATIQSAEDL